MRNRFPKRSSCRMVAVARYRMIGLVLVNAELFPLPCGAGSTGNLSVIILASLLVCPMLGCLHSLLRLSNISRFSQVECTFSNIPTCEHLPVGEHLIYLLFLVLIFEYKSFLQGHLLFVVHY